MIELLLGQDAPETAPAVGQVMFTTTGTTSWTVPAKVYEISAVAVNAGKNGIAAGNSTGGSGGDLRYAKSIPVTPGEVLSIVVAAANGLETCIKRGSTALLSAGNQGGFSSTLSTNIGGGNGGAGGTPIGTGSGFGSGGGGAGGYSGNGGIGARASGSSGGVSASSGFGGGGGGVGLFGPGANGVYGVSVSVDNSTFGGYGGGGGSSGNTGRAGLANAQSVSLGGYGGGYGGGGGGTVSGGSGGQGAIRIIWGKGRAYPSTNVADM